MCSYFFGKYLSSCNAGSRTYMPSDFEMSEYCRSSRYKICPFYLKAARTSAGCKGTFARPEIMGREDAVKNLSRLR